jgi:hypothetical protein
MATFLVTTDLYPGVARSDIGFVRSGETFWWPPTAKDRPSIKLQPVDVEAYQLLVDTHGVELVQARWGDAPKAPPAKPEALQPMSVREVAELHATPDLTIGMPEEKPAKPEKRGPRRSRR